MNALDRMADAMREQFLGDAFSAATPWSSLDDVEREKHRERARQAMNALRSKPITRRDQVLQFLEGQDAGSEEIGRALNTTINHTTCILSEIKRREYIHICRWDYTGHRGRPRAIYRAGPGVDAVLVRRTSAESARHRRDRHRAEADKARQSEIARHAIEIAMYGGPASVTVRIPPVPVDAWEAA